MGKQKPASKSNKNAKAPRQIPKTDEDGLVIPVLPEVMEKPQDHREPSLTERINNSSGFIVNRWALIWTPLPVLIIVLMVRGCS